jgi:hypothetical protein
MVFGSPFVNQVAFTQFQKVSTHQRALILFLDKFFGSG